MGQGSQGGIGTDKGACPIPPLPSRKNRYPWSLRTFSMSVGFSVVILSNLFLISFPVIVLPLALPIPQAPPGANVYLARTDASGNVQWNHAYGGLDVDVGYSVIETFDGGFVVAGSTNSYGSGNTSMWLIRTNSTGHPIWDNSYGGTKRDECYDLAECDDGGFIIAGETFSYGVGENDVILVRTDIFGNVTWLKTFGGAGEDRATSIVKCGAREYVISATTNSFGAGSYDMWLIRIDSLGELIWEKTFGGPLVDEANSVTLCEDGGFLLVGMTQRPIADPGSVWIVRTDSGGNHIWNRTYFTAGLEYGWSAVECPDGGFAVVGTIDYPRESDLPDILFMRFDADGLLQGSPKKLGGSGIADSLCGNSIVSCSDGGFAIAGKYGSQSSQNDIWLCRMDVDGNDIWSTNYQGAHTGAGFLLGDCHDGGFVITGTVETPVEPTVIGLATLSDVRLELTVAPQEGTRLMPVVREDST
ncbi:MAG: hypothetical protein ACXABV_13445 [Candidatus Thorarchaeota archaeon]